MTSIELTVDLTDEQLARLVETCKAKQHELNALGVLYVSVDFQNSEDEPVSNVLCYPDPSSNEWAESSRILAEEIVNEMLRNTSDASSVPFKIDKNLVLPPHTDPSRRSEDPAKPPYRSESDRPPT